MDDEVIIISVETGEAVRNVGDLRTNIAAYKETLNGLDIGSKEYADTLNALQINQAALKDAMHATTSEGDAQGRTMEQIAKDAMGLGTSYNSLVRQMAQLDQQFRAEEDAVKRAALGAEIKNINAQLKELDEARGKYGRNVGNYKSAIEGLGGAFKATAGSAAGLITPIQGATSALRVLSTTPVIGMLGLLAGALSKVIGGLESSEKNTDKWRMALAAFQPIADAATRTIQGIGSAVADVANWIVDLLDKWGLMKKEMSDYQDLESASQAVRDLARKNIEENAKLEADAAEHRAKAADKEKYTAEQRLGFLREAQREEKAIMLNNLAYARERVRILQEEAKHTENSTKVLDELARARAELYRVESDYNKTMRRLTRETNTTLNETRRGTAAVTGELARAIEDDVEAAEAAAQDYLDSIGGVKSAGEELFAQIVEMDDARIAERERAAAAERAVEEANQQYFDEQLQRERERNQQRISIALQYAGAVGSIAGSLADIYEQNAENDEAAAAKSKALQIAAATIQTIGGAVSAFMSTWNAKEIPMTAKMVLAPLNAASVLAAGYAQIRSMTSVKMGKGGSAAANTPAVVSAPSGGSSSIQQVRTITGAAEEDRLNKMASNQRVYLVYSDIEAADNARRVQVNETTF